MTRALILQLKKSWLSFAGLLRWHQSSFTSGSWAQHAPFNTYTMKTWLLSVFLLSLLVIITTQESSKDDPVVKLNHGGQVRGSIMKSQKGKKIHAFRGIPYAEPPTGDKRFKPPVPKVPWQGTPHDATSDGPVCVQIDFMTQALLGQEDCLYLNVYTPELSNDNTGGDDDNDDKRPVLVFIHGGGFEFGHGASFMYGPGKLLDGGVVLVSMNYRLGPLGFLSTCDDVSRGNYGLMDQSLALKWVNENIEAFGGDAGRVAIFGESAGGASVGYHLLSPMSSGFFQAAISQSGSPMCSWAFQEEPVYWSKKLAKDFKCSTETSTEIVNCLRGVPAIDIIKKSLTYKAVGIMPLLFVPTLDGKFLTMDPREAITSGKIVNKVPFITGVNKDEGIFFYIATLRNHPSTDLTSKKDISEVIKYILDDKGTSDEPSKLVAEKYFSQIDMNNKEITRKAVIRSFSDASFDMCHYETAKLMSDHGVQTYAYSLDYAPSVGFSRFFGVQESWGVGHGDDLFLQFDGEIFDLMKPTEDDEKVTKIVRLLWTNLVKHGDPVPKVNKLLPVKWEPSGSGKINVLHINTELTTSTYDTSKEELYDFWINKVQRVLDKTIQRHDKDEL